MADQPVDETQEIIIRDGSTSNNELKVNADGSLNVISSSGGTQLAEKTFGISYVFTPASASETPVLLLKNPSGNSLSIYLRDLLVSALAPDIGSIIRVYANPTISANGTAMTVTSFLIGGTNTTTMQAYRNPTVSANGTLLLTSSILKAITAESDREFTYARIFLANNNLLITLENSATNRDVAVTISWKEE